MDRSRSFARSLVVSSLVLPFWAIAADPASAEAATRILPILPGDRMLEDAEGFTAHVSPVGGDGTEEVFSCREGIHLAPGRYAIWVESEEWISAVATHLISSGDGGGVSGIGVVPAGRVTLPAGFLGSSDLELRLRHVEQADYALPGVLLFEFLRTKPLLEVDDAGLRMPRGQTLAYLWNPGSKTIEAISRPFEVRAGHSVTAPLTVPQGNSDLVAQFTRDQVPAGPDRRTDVRIKVAGRSIEPDFLVQIDRQVLALWYGLAPGKAELVAELDHQSAPRLELELAAGQITFVERRLQRRPALEVQLSLPEALREENLVVRVAKVSDRSVVAEQKVGRTQVLDFAEMPAAEVEVVLQTSLGQVKERVDLSDGTDASVFLAANVIELAGTVFLGEQEQPAAALDFVTTDDHKIAVVADASGYYQVTSLSPLRQVVIRLEDAEGSPFRQFFYRAIAESSERDFYLPDAQIAVDVIDQTTGQGIPGASVAVRNLFAALDAEGRPIPSPAIGAPAPRDSVAQTIETDDDGKTLLLYLKGGEVEITASAAGYRPAPIITRAIRSGDRQRLDLRLEKIGDTVGLRLLLADGRPAAGADAELLVSFESDDPLWAGQADADGLLSPPRSFSGAALLIRHAAGAWAGIFQPAGEDEPEATLTLPAALPPLVARIRDAEGRPMPHARIKVWVAGQRWSEGALLFFDMSFAADQDGFWRVPSPPARFLSILAYSPRHQTAAQAGQLDVHAGAITFPWPELVEISGID